MGQNHSLWYSTRRVIVIIQKLLSFVLDEIMKKFAKFIFPLLLLITGGIIVTGLIDPIINNLVYEKIGRNPGLKSMSILKNFGFGLILLSVLIAFIILKWQTTKNFWVSKIIPMISSFDLFLLKTRTKLFGEPRTNKEIKWNEMNRWDIGFLIFTLLISSLLVIERLQGNYPDVILGSDAANISSMAVSLDNPELFPNDFYLQEPDNFKLYFQLHVPIIRGLGKFLDNYSLPFVILLGPTTFITLLGNYMLGRTILKNRFWALIFVGINSIPVYLLFENWGLAEDSVPRTFMQALFPFLLLLIWLWKESPRKWIWISIFTGLLTYVHAVGTPTVMVSVMISFLVFLPKDWSLLKKFSYWCFLGLLMVIVGSFFIINYLSIKNQVGPFDYETIMHLYRTYFPPNILDVKTSIGLLIRFFTKTLILPLGVISLLVLWFLREESRKLASLTFAWLVGISLVSVLIPYSERIIESYLRLLPLETELIRGTRFFVPILSLVSIGGLSHVFFNSKSNPLKISLGLIGLLFLVNYFTFRSTNLLFFEKTRACINQAKFLCNDKSDLQNLLSNINELTPPKSSIYYTNHSQDTLPLAVRYISNRSLVYSWKDRGMGFSHPGKMIVWHEIFEVIDKYPTSADWYKTNPQEFVDFVTSLNADYFVLQKNNLNVSVVEGEIIYENPTYFLVKIPNSNY